MKQGQLLLELWNKDLTAQLEPDPSRRRSARQQRRAHAASRPRPGASRGRPPAEAAGCSPASWSPNRPVRPASAANAADAACEAARATAAVSEARVG